MFQSALQENINLMKVILKLLPVRGAFDKWSGGGFFAMSGKRSTAAISLYYTLHIHLRKRDEQPITCAFRKRARKYNTI